MGSNLARNITMVCLWNLVVDWRAEWIYIVTSGSQERVCYRCWTPLERLNAKASIWELDLCQTVTTSSNTLYVGHLQPDEIRGTHAARFLVLTRSLQVIKGCHCRSLWIYVYQRTFIGQIKGCHLMSSLSVITSIKSDLLSK